MAGATRLGYDPVGATRPTGAITHSQPSRKADAYDGASRPTRAAIRLWNSQGGAEYYKCLGGASSTGSTTGRGSNCGPPWR